MKNETKNKKRSTKSLFRRMVKLGKRGRNSRKWAAKIQVISFIVYYYSNFLKFDYITGEFFYFILICFKISLFIIYSVHRSGIEAYTS